MPVVICRAVAWIALWFASVTEVPASMVTEPLVLPIVTPELRRKFSPATGAVASASEMALLAVTFSATVRAPTPVRSMLSPAVSPVSSPE